jgi:hypothetical protein
MEFRIPDQKPPEASSDEQAELEVTAYAMGLDAKSSETARRLKKLERRDAVDGLAYTILRWFMITASVIVMASFLVLFFHFLAPESWLYLSDDRISRLKELLLSGSIGAALAAIGKSSLIEK